MSQIAYGSLTIVDTTDIQRFYIEYAKNNNSASAPSNASDWSQNRPQWSNGSYIWQRTVIKKQGISTPQYGTPVCITGEKGDTGETGRGITSVITLYCNYGTGTPVQGYSGWMPNVPSYDKTKPNYWVKTTTNYDSGDPTITIYKDTGLTQSMESANLALVTAQEAESNSIIAIRTADGKNQIFYGSNFPHDGEYKEGDTLFYQTENGTILYRYDSEYSDTTTYHWKREQFEENAISDLAITNAKVKNLSGDKIIANTIAGNKIIAHDITAVQLATDAIKSSNYRAGTAPYSLTGTFLDLSNGNIFTPNFGVNNDSTDNIDNGAYIRGSVYASDGTIGSDINNYWYIGNYYDYNQGQSAMLRSHGTAAIQLGDSNTWRVATDRIHTSWNDDSTSGEAFRLHYPSYGGKYWDSGLHVPTSATDKLLYIRNASTSTSLENLQNDINDTSGGHYWNYQFYLTSNGSLYAKNIYIMDDNGNTTQIGGTDGVYLLKSGGTITGDLQVNGAIKNSSGSAITLQTNLGSTTAGTLTGNSTNPINIGITGTLPVARGGTGNTNYTSGGVVYVSNANPKTLLSNAAGTSGHLLASGGSGAPTWINPGTLTVAAATKATQDGDGNVIKTTYLKLSGGNVTGPVSFGDSVSIDDLNAGTLVVTGNSSFTNNIQANTINGVAVGSSPKFTDTVTTVTTSGNGNAVTAITASGGKLTITKGTTFLTSFTQTDPVFTASAAASIKQTDIDNWNSKTSNTGTVTSVAASGSGGITISGSPVTTSGTITIGLNLSTAINGLGEGTSPATREDYAVVQYSDGGTSTTSYHRRKLSNVFKALNSDDIINALGYTPYNNINPDGYTKNVGTVTSIATSSPITGGTITSSGTIGHATSGVGNTITTAGFYKFKYDTYGHVTGVTSVAKADITGLGIPAQDTTYSNASTTTAGLMSAADKKKLDNIQVDSSGQAVAANVAGRWGIDVTFSDANVAQVGHANSAITASNTQASKITSSVTSTQLAFGDVINFPYVTYDTYGHVTGKTNLYFKMPAAPSSTTDATNAIYATYDASEASNTTKITIANKYIPKSIGTAAGDIIYWSASGTPTRLAKGSNGQVLKLANGVPTWGTDNNDNTWRAIQVNGTDILGIGTSTNKLNLKAGTNVSLSNSSGTVTITATDVKVTQTNTTGNADYRLLFSENANDTDSTETARKNTNLKFNPSSGLLKTYGISSAAGSTPVIYSDVSATEIKAADSSLTTSSSDSDWLKALLIALCTKYPNRSSCIFKGTMSPNSTGWYEVHIYSTSIKDSTTGLPQYSFGRFLKYINNYELFGTASYTYSYRTVDTNTWNALSTSQAGYVSTAPNDTAKFLRGDATWAQVSSANLSDIRLTWNSSVSTTDWILAHDAAATGTPLFRAMSPANLKTTMSLNHVENKSSATIRGELTSSNVITALGYTPVNKAGDAMTGGLNITATNSIASFDEGIRLNYSNRNFAGLVIGGAANSTTGITDGAWWIGTSSSSGGGLFRKLTIAHNTGSAAGTYFYATSATQTNPNLRLPTSGTITSGNMDAVNGGTVYTALTQGYVTLTTEQIVSGRKTFSDLAAVTFKPSSGTDKCNINYNATLGALVFSF